MPRVARLVATGEKTVYHVISRTALPGFPLQDVEKDYFVDIIKKKSRLYFTEIIGYAIMGNHFHLLVRMLPETEFTDKDIEKRFKEYYGDDYDILPGEISIYRKKWEKLSEFMKDVKQEFSRFYNKRHHRRGFFWGERFKSVIVQDGFTLVNCLAYIDLNPVRAKLVERPEEYRWSSIGYHVQTNNMDQFLSLDFGMKDFGVRSDKRLREYRRDLYEKGGEDKGRKIKIDEKIVEKERKRDFQLSETDRFLYRTRYFTDSGVIGSKEFVSRNYKRFQHVFRSKHEKKPKAVKGIDGMYSLKRLAESI